MIFPRREDATNEELVSTIIEIQGWLSRYGNPHTNWHETLNEVIARLEKMESGKWEWDQRTGEYVCSECGCNPVYERTIPDASEIDKYRYCRWCGAPMEVDG